MKNLKSSDHKSFRKKERGERVRQAIDKIRRSQIILCWGSWGNSRIMLEATEHGTLTWLAIESIILYKSQIQFSPFLHRLFGQTTTEQKDI